MRPSLGPLRFIVPGGAGGPGSLIAGIIAERLSRRIGCPVGVDQVNGQIPGLSQAAMAPADGRTIVMAGGTYYIGASLYKKLPFKPLEDFSPVSLVANIGNVLVVHQALPVRSVKELIAYSRAHPGTLRYGSTGLGSPPHVAGELFNSLTGAKLVHVPFKGHAAAAGALCEGRDIQVMFDAIASALSHIRSGELRGLGVCTSGRVSVLPDVPTLAEGGLAGLTLSAGTGILAPVGIPDAILRQLSHELASLMREDEVRVRLEEAGIEALGSSPEYYSRYIRDQIKQWADVLRQIGIPQLDVQ